MEFGVSPLPPLGKFLSPYSGFWRNAEPEKLKYPESVQLKGLEQPVQIVYDDRLVPHIFAANDHDLYFAQGFITARHRLWQMEFQTHFAAGRISEIVGPKALELDRMTRRKGLLSGAEEALKHLEHEPLSDKILTSYTDGVNAYISSLTYKDYPIEYKLLNYKPEPWTKLKCALLLKYMSDMLTGKSYDIELSNAISLLGEENVALLYPDFPADSLAGPIVPGGVPFKPNHFDLDTPLTAGLYNKIPIVTEKVEQNIGSNNWAVNGKKTKSGAPILCNDPHLQLNLPSIWFEIQLSTPECNTYGVSLPGAPAIVIGFNQDIAWGVTNGTQDVKDWYKVKFKDSSKKEYWYDGAWKPTTIRVEKINVRGQAPYYDTIYYTHYGPVVYDTTFVNDTVALDLASRWTGQDVSNEMLTFYLLNRAKGYDDYVKALENFQTPGQNFVFASRTGDIAIWQQGHFPLKWPGQGKFVMDGSMPAYQWQGFIPQDENPHVLNPERNFVTSANQHPTNSTYPYYYNGFFEYYRNRRIIERLSMMNNITVEDMMQLQNDNFNLHAAEALPYFLQHLDKSKITSAQQAYLAELEKWDYMNGVSSIAAAVFEEWYLALDSLIYDELMVMNKMTILPQEYNTVQLLKQYPEHPILDIRSTQPKENAAMLIQQGFGIACQKLDDWKQNHKESLTWSNYKHTTVQHLARLLPFSVNQIEIGGNRRIVNACSDRWGPSWRMIVSLETPIRAYGVYPGGQSGNPGSHYYTTGIEKWSKGEYFELLFFTSADEQNSRVLFRQTLNH